MGLIKYTIFVVILAYLSKCIYIFLADSGVGVHFNNVHPGPCRIIPGISCGSEQISVTKDGFAFITNGFKGMTRCNPKFTKGNLYLFDFNHPDNNVTKLNIISENLDLDTFDPHGMDIIELPEQGIVNLYVVNHADDIESVEVFVYNREVPDEIVHTTTIVDDTFVCLNDIAVIDKQRFYVTNYLKYCKSAKILLTIEILGKFQTSNIVYFNHGQTAIVATGSGYNGITLSKEKSKVLSVSCSQKDLHIFDRDQSDGLLSLKKKVFLGHNPDNIFLDKGTGHFYIAYFKDPLMIQMVAENRSEYSSAGACMLSVESEQMDNIDIKEVFYDNGEKFVSAASSFVHYKGQYLIGTVFDKLGYCRKM